MKIKYLLLFIILIFFTNNYLFSKENNYFNELRLKTKISKNEKILIFFFKNGDCPSCYIRLQTEFDCLKSIKNKLKIIALVECDRDIEVKTFVKEHEWAYEAYLNDGTAKIKLKINKESIAALFDFNGNLLSNFKNNEVKDLCKKIKKIIH